jgi:putative acetyltransferase
MQIRAYRKSDTQTLADLYRDSVRGIGPQAYTPEEVTAWALYPEDLDEFCVRLSRGLTLIAELDGRVAAFGQLDPADHIAFLYTATSFQRRGLATAIYAQLEARAIAQAVDVVHTEASRISRSLFEKLAFRVIEIEHVVRYGITFERFRMQKGIRANKAPEPTITSVTPRADARVAPAAIVAHL